MTEKTCMNLACSVVKLSLVFALALLAMGCPSRAGNRTIAVYDLRYTLELDRTDADQLARVWDHSHAAATLQGIVNRSAPRLYLFFVESQHGKGSIDQYWLDQLRVPGAWLAETQVETVPDIVALVQRFRGDLNGAVVYDPKVPATSNLASTAAGADNLLALRYDTNPDSLYSQLVTAGPKLPVKLSFVNPDGSSRFTGSGKIPDTDLDSTGSTKCDAYLWMKQHYLDTSRSNANYGAYYLDQYWMKKYHACVFNHHCLTNHDFFVSKKAWFFDLHVWADETPIDDPGQKLGTDLNTLKALLLSAYNQGGDRDMIHIGGFVPWAYKYTNARHAGGKHEGVASEWEYARIISAYNAFMDADAIGYGAMANASFYAHFPLKKHYPQSWVTHDELRQRGYLTADGKVDFKNREFLIFYVGDYDAAAWIYQRAADIWDDPNRGKVPLMWCMSPMLDRRAPMAMDYLRRTATPNDYFASADNGAGYCLPGMLQEPRPISGLPSGLPVWQKHCKKYYDRWGLSITGFIIDAYGPDLNEKGLACYQSFSPNGIVPTRGPAFSMFQNMPVVRFDHDITENDPAAAAHHIVQRIKGRRDEGKPPFHWFRNILKTPTWHVNVMEEIKQRNPNVELLDGPTFFELVRIHLSEPNP